MSDSKLLVRNLSKSFGGIQAVNNVSFDLEPGTITGLIGPNGAGKTTAFDCITGFQKPDSTSSVYWKGQALTQLTPDQISRLGIGRTFQLVRLLPRLTALDNLVVAAPNHPGERFAGALFGGWREHERLVRRRAMAQLDSIGMTAVADVQARHLSYGQTKLVELARLFMMDSQLLFLDEPMAGIAPKLRQHMLDVLHRARTQEGRTLLIVEHDLDMIMDNCDRVLVMDQGQLIADGTPDAVRADPAVATAYLGGIAS